MRLPILFIAGTMALAQAPPAFEAALIKPFQGLAMNVRFNVSGPRITITEYGLPGLLMAAYKVEPWQISGGPAWLDSDRFDIAAIAPGETKPTSDQIQQMLQTLLADRFQPKVHREIKEGLVYALVVDKKGPKFKPSTSADSTLSLGGSRTVQMTFQKRTMEYLALQLSNSSGLGRAVLDKTGLAGTYDFNLEWAPNPLPDSILIDHAEKPSPN